ncbi:MAG: hypothetical protein ABFS30_09840 [Pseudomonadota bacterium]|jgi:hypothetical protein
MAGDKVSVTFEVQEDAVKMLDYAAKMYGMPDRDKALRVLLDYLAKDANWNQIFTLIRCVRCSDKGGWKEPAS